MSARSRRCGRSKGTKAGRWKVIDDHSGMVVMSDKVKIDHRGRMTSANNYDKMHYTEMKIDYPIDQPIPFARPEPADNMYSPGGLGVSNLPITYNDTWNTQPVVTQTAYPTVELNPQAQFGNYIAPSTFGPNFPNSTNDIVDITNSGRFTSWGDSYDYFVTTGTLGTKGLL